MRKYLDIISNPMQAEAATQTSGLLQRYVGLIEEGYVHQTIGGVKVDEFVRGYIECMLWSSKDDMDEPLNKSHTADDIDSQTMDRIYADCRSFIHSVGPFITIDNFKGANLSSVDSRAGHDFWLTRVGHGAGFWDGDWASEGSGIDGPLTKAANAFGNVDPYVGDDGKVHLA